MTTFRDLLSAAKAEITEVDTSGAAERIAQGALVLDVREPDEYEQGALGDAVHIPRGNLESSIEARVPDKTAPVIIHCASGAVLSGTRASMLLSRLPRGMCTAPGMAPCSYSSGSRTSSTTAPGC